MSKSSPPGADGPVLGPKTRVVKHGIRATAYASLTLAALVAVGVGISGSTTYVIGHPLSDVSDHVQGMWWFGGEILSGRMPLDSRVTHGPGATALWFIDPVGGMLSIPFRWMGPAMAYNAVIAVQLLLSAIVLGWMVRDLTDSHKGALIGGLIMVSSPFVLGVIHSGLSEYVGLTPVVLYLWVLIRITDRDPRERAVPQWCWMWGALALTLVALQSMVLLLCALVLTACFIPGREWRDRLQRMVPMLALASVPISGLGQLIYNTLSGPVGLESVPGWTQPGLPGVDLLGFISPFTGDFPHTTRAGAAGIVHVHFLGWIALLLAIAGWIKLPKLRLPVGLDLLMCLGPVLVIAGQEIPSTESAIRLPLAILYWDALPFHWVHHPYRLTALLVPLLALLAAVGAATVFSSTRGFFFAFLFIDLLLLSPIKTPIAATDITPPPQYAALPPGPVMEWPPDATDWNRRYVRWQPMHGHTIAYGVNTGMPDAARQDPMLWNLFLKLDDPAQRLWNRDTPPQNIPSPLLPLQPIAAQGYTGFVLHLQAMSTGEHARTIPQLRSEYGAPTVVSADVLIWDLRP